MNVMDTIMHFIWNWTTYFCMIPIWVTIMALLIKWQSKRVLVEDLFMIFFFSLTNPLWNTFLVFGIPAVVIASAVLVFHETYWQKIKDKEIF